MVDPFQVAAEVNKWGLQNFSANGDSCNLLYETMTRNYPCMKQGICTPYNQTYIVIAMVLVGLLLFYVGYYFAEKKYKPKKDATAAKK